MWWVFFVNRIQPPIQTVVFDSIGCQTVSARNAMIVGKSLQRLGDGIIAGCVDRFSAAAVVIRKFQGKS